MIYKRDVSILKNTEAIIKREITKMLNAADLFHRSIINFHREPPSKLMQFFFFSWAVGYKDFFAAVMPPPLVFITIIEQTFPICLILAKLWEKCTSVTGNYVEKYCQIGRIHQLLLT